MWAKCEQKFSHLKFVFKILMRMIFDKTFTFIFTNVTKNILIVLYFMIYDTIELGCMDVDFFVEWK